MDDSNRIHPTAILDGRVQLGKRNQIGPYCVLHGPLVIGDDNVIGPHVVLGSPSADTRDRYADGSDRVVEIGSRNIIREFSAIQKPRYRELTHVGNDCFLMQGANVSHDVVLDDGVVLAAGCTLAGVARVMTCGYLGMACTIHQFSVIGPYSIAATGAAVTKNIRPFSRYIPGKPTSVNQYAVEKYGMSEHQDEIRAYVLAGRPPTSEVVGAIVDAYQRLHVDSKRREYE